MPKEVLRIKQDLLLDPGSALLCSSSEAEIEGLLQVRERTPAYGIKNAMRWACSTHL